ncbi:hypothetical protein KKD80_03930 [Patescibacteria group bacterium]|nr:hypothetical protein [Patescibacteria group bacterium]
MEKGSEREFAPKTESVNLKLSWFDFRAGHWSGLKDPPWGLNLLGMISLRWPEIKDVLAKAEKELELEEEKVFWSGKIEFPDGRMEDVDLKIWKRKLGEGRASIDLWIWPKAEKYYKKK